MTGNEYQKLVRRTRNIKAGCHMELANYSMGLAGEIGEVIDHLKKHVFYEHDIGIEYIKKEFGDVLWYLAAASDVLALPLDEIMESNINKLRQRYPDGFSAEASRNREEGSV